jgi:hypothetical protein
MMEGSETWAGSGAVQIRIRDPGGPRTYLPEHSFLFYDLNPQLEMHFIRNRVADPHSFHPDPDPDPAF